MKSIKILSIFALVASTSTLADIFPFPMADSGLVSVFPGQTPQLNVVNVGNSTRSCSFNLSFIDSLGNTMPTPPAPTFTVGGVGLPQAASLALPVPAGATTLLRAHIDFSPQLLANQGQVDPMNGCFHLIPTFEVTNTLTLTTVVLNTRFYGMPSLKAGEKLQKVGVCHKPGTPAQQNLWIPTSALRGHLGHGDKLGACS